MNYLIKLLKSCFAGMVTVKATRLAVDLACRSEEGVFYAFPGVCQLAFDKNVKEITGRSHHTYSTTKPLTF
ncbi:hypothetical protein CE457_19145 [Vreelandella boliviensis LC1]|uniref:Uncharacterized protein n=1 Tax=Vreelandella boliviensis LC1 TaxID=1072583 RepID=A0ABX4G9N9_9GAMM|nr:hypothetical protein CE457_19145 [Halomonas boliviensis LC1]